MKSAIKQSYSQVNQTKMVQVEPAYWLRLLGNRNGVNGSAGFGQNGDQAGGERMAAESVSLAARSAYWLRLLGGPDQTIPVANNGRVAPPGSPGSGKRAVRPGILAPAAR